MSPVTHLLVGWTIAQATPLLRRDRALVTLASVVPDLDGAGLLIDLATRSSASPTSYWAAWHHVIGHGLAAGLLVAALALALSSRRAVVVLLAFASFHAHVVGDLVGARGPDGDQWPIHYLWPASDVGLTWSGQWALNAWPNFALTALLVAFALVVGWARGVTPVELISARGSAAVVDALRARFGPPRSAPRREAR